MLRPWLPATALVLVLATGAGAEPRRPGDPAEVLERLPAVARPAVADGTVRLDEARAWAERAALTQDSRFAGYARAALGPAWDAADPAPAALVLRAVLQQHRHAFAQALADLDRAVALAPGDPQARLTRAAVRLVSGDPAGSLEDCRALGRLAVARVAVATCAALAASRSGQARPAAVMLAGALGDGQEVPPALRAWSFTAMGEILAGLGREDEAEPWFQRAVEAAPDDAYARQALADHWLATGRPERVVALVADRVANDGHRLRLGLAWLALGDPRAAEAVRGSRERYAALHARGETTARREEARLRLALGEAAAALPAALANWQGQREPIDAMILLDAARAAGRPDAARPVRAWIAATGIEDVRLQARLAALALDADGDRAVTWGEVARREAEIAAWASSGITLESAAGACPLRPGALLVDRHADGVHAVVPFATACAGTDAALTLSYRLLAAIDPSHRGLVRDGVRHILSGYDHRLFLVTLLLPAVLRREAGRWRPVGGPGEALATVVAVEAGSPWLVASAAWLQAGLGP